MINNIINKIKFSQVKNRLSNLIDSKSQFQVKNINFISFNGRTCSFCFFDKKSNKKLFVKKFLFLNNDKYLMSDLINEKYALVNLLWEKGLISYQPYKVNGLGDLYLRDYVPGITFKDFSKNLNNSDFESKMSELLLYIEKILTCMSKHSFFKSLDMRLDNFLVSNTGEIDIIDLDLSHVNATSTNTTNTNTINPIEFKTHTYAKFFVKSVESLTRINQNIFFNLMRDRLDNFEGIKDAILCRYFYSGMSIHFDNFISENYLHFSNSIVSFSEVSVKEKLISTLSELNPKSYSIARRYDWLINDSDFNSKDIDIFCSEDSALEVISVFKKNGWDVYNGRIKQFFDSCEILVTIDLRFDTEKRYGLDIDGLIERSEDVNNIKMICELDYHEIMMSNLFKFKNYLKASYINEFYDYCPKAPLLFKDKYSYLLNYNFYYYQDKLFLTLYQKNRRILGDFVNHKNVVLLGADGAGKSTFSKLIYKNISLRFKSEIKYYGGFFYPSGRTNLFYFKTSIVFRYLQLIYNARSKKAAYSLIKNEIVDDKNISQTPEWRKLSVIKKPFVQLIFVLILPVFILDIWLHRLVSRFTRCRLLICDRYYDDIILNFTSSHVRNFIRMMLPVANYSIYFYTTPDRHFMRKRNEDIEMIVHMQSCYSEKKYYDIKLPTNARRFFLGKKIVSMLIKKLK